MGKVGEGGREGDISPAEGFFAKKSHRRTDNIAGDPSPVRVLSQR